MQSPPTLLESLVQHLSNAIRPIDDDAVLPPLEWTLKHRRLEERPFTLDRHIPLRQIYEDESRHIVVMKPAQVGVSEWAISRATHALDCGAQFYQTDKAGLNVAYLFPTRDALTDFSKERLSSLQRESEHLSALFTDFDAILFKQARNSYLYLRSTWGEAPLLSFPADMLILDEYDRMDGKSIALAQKRLRASPLKIELDISTPTLPGRGIHALYLQSDQHEWEIPCDHCDAWTTLDFFRDVQANGATWEHWQHWHSTKLHLATMTTHCARCHAPIDRLSPDGRWMARAPESPLRGYHIPSLAFSMVDLNELAVNAVNPDPSQQEEFFRSDLGLPFEAAGSSVTEAMMRQLATPIPAQPAWQAVTMGIDIGKYFHWRINSMIRQTPWLRAVGTARTWDELSQIMREYQVQRVVIDALPELHGAQTWAAQHPGKVYRAFYNANLKELWKQTEEGVVQINRTAAMDAVYARMTGLQERWADDVLFSDEFVAHMKAPVRVVTTKSDGQPLVTWAHTLPDHFYHASVYALIAQSLAPKSRPSVLVQATASGWGVPK
jgi:hypothetical protein